MGRCADRTRHSARRARTLIAYADVSIEHIGPSHVDAWRDAYATYAAAVDSPVDAATIDRIWLWLVAPVPKIEGLVATVDGRFAGFAHFRAFPRTLDGNEAGFLDDLYVVPAFRGSPVVRAIFTRLESIARERDWSHLRWVTSAGNAHARALYDRIARPLDLITYRLDTSPRR